MSFRWKGLFLLFLVLNAALVPGGYTSGISAGCVCGRPESEDAIQDLISAADRQLYQAKENGRGRLSMA